VFTREASRLLARTPERPQPATRLGTGRAGFDNGDGLSTLTRVDNMRWVVCSLVLFGSWGCSPASVRDSAQPDSSIAAEDREISFQAGDLSLNGTLSLPLRVRGAGVPGVVLINGSGPSDRNEALSGQLGMSFGFRISVFQLLAEGLRDSGIAVLRYDKRACGSFNGCADNEYPTPSPNISAEDLENDVIAGVDYLKAQPGVDPARVSLVGHSEGGAFVIPILTRRPDIQQGVMISAPFTPMDQIVRDQIERLRALFAQTGTPRAQADTQLAPLDAAAAALLEVRAGTYTGGPILGAYGPYWASLLAIGDENPSQSSRLDRPLLAIGGSYDWNVPPSELAEWQANFQAAVNPDARKTSLLECMTHALNCIAQPDPTQIKASDIGSTLQPELVPKIADFIHGR
jgi:pimeloyl-ACP methyl ester carboxylesterase